MVTRFLINAKQTTKIVIMSELGISRNYPNDMIVTLTKIGFPVDLHKPYRTKFVFDRSQFLCFRMLSFGVGHSHLMKNKTTLIPNLFSQQRGGAVFSNMKRAN